MKSNTCFSKATGKPLSFYNYEFEAQSAADYSRVFFGNDLVPYRCEKCTHWHLSPKNRSTPSKKCDWCTGSDGRFKDTYRTRKDAIIRAKIIYEEYGVDLKVYECEKGDGWHLTKSF